MNGKLRRFATVLGCIGLLALTPWIVQAAAGFSEVTGAGNPLNGVNLTYWTHPAFADLDGDGDLESIVGCYDGTLHFYRNTGTVMTPTFVEATGAANPFNGQDVGYNGAPALGDLDGDGDIDALVGATNGLLHFYRNTGTVLTPTFTEMTGAENPFNAITVTNNSAPALADIDGDGDLDAFNGELEGTIHYYRNIGTVLTPTFTEITGTANPLNGVSLYRYTALDLGDIDGDGDLDALIGAYVDHVILYRNDGTATAPVFVATSGSDNPFNGMANWYDDAPTFADIDSDGDLDVFVGEQDGRVHFFRNNDTEVPTFYLQEITGAENPLSDITAASYWYEESAPELADIDSDGDLDAVMGFYTGTLGVYRNDGTVIAPHFTEVISSQSPLSPDVGFNSTPALGDLDGDGDLDAVIGEDDGFLNYYQNMGTAATPAFITVTGTANPFDGLDAGDGSKPCLGDLDGDGDLDAVVGTAYTNTIKFYRNTGTAMTPTFSEVTGSANPFLNIDLGPAGSHTAPRLTDVDDDGDLDALIGNHMGTFALYRNDGTPLTPTFALISNYYNLNTKDVGFNSTPALVDLDGDGDLDLVSGDDAGTIHYYRNIWPQITVLGNGTVITNGDTTPDSTNNTDFGLVEIGKPVTRTFVISNSSTDNLSILGLQISDSLSGTFSISAAPLPVTISAGSAVSFQVRFSPPATGIWTATVNINHNALSNNDLNTFLVQGTGASRNLTLFQQVEPLIARYHQPVTYTLVLSNSSLFSETARLTDTLPDKVEFSHWVVNPGAVVNGKVLTWTGELSTSSRLTFTFVATQTGNCAEIITNTAEFNSLSQSENATTSFRIWGELFLPLVLRHGS